MKNHWDNILKEFFTSTLPNEAKREVVDLIELNQRGREDVCVFSEEMLGISLNDFQRKFLERSTTPRSLWSSKFGVDIEDIGGYLFGRNIACPSNQVGKGLYKKEKVLSNNGWREIGSLKVGDKIYSQDGTLTRVKGVFPQGKVPLYRFMFDDGASVVADEQHRWSVLTPTNRFSKTFNDIKRFGKTYPNENFGTYEVMSTNDILSRFGANPKPTQRIAIPVVEPIQFPSKKVPLDPYIIGLLLGDGWIPKKGSPRIASVDESILQSFGLHLGGRLKGCSYLVKKVSRILRSLGLSGCRSWEKFVPKEYLWNSVDVRLGVLQGLMDTDGSIYGKVTMEYATTSKQLAEDVKFLVQSLGGKCEIKERTTTFTYKGEKKKGRLSYRLKIRIQGINPFRLKRKADKFYKVRYRRERILHSIERVEDGESVCIAVEHPSNLFVTEDFIVTHNTVMIAVKHLWFSYYKIGLDLEESLIDKAHYQTLNVSPHSRQVRQCYNYVKDILDERFIIDEEGKKRVNKLHPLVKDFLAGENSTLGELRFRNKSVFYTVPTGQDQASSLAGAQFGYISYDECAQSLHLENELGAKIMSRLIKYGVALDLISTPEVDSPSHQYYLHIVKLGLAGKEGWWALNAVLDDNKFIPKAQRDRAKADLLSTNKQKYRQVVFGEFISGGKRFFEPKEIENMWKLSSKRMCEKGHKYLLVADWGISDTGDESVFMVLDYTNWSTHGKLQLVNHEVIKGGSPYMQFALLRTLYDGYTWYGEDGVTENKPTFVMDAKALGGVVIKKLLVLLQPKGFNIEKDEALMFFKKELSSGRDYYESEVDGAIIEKNPDFGSIESYYIEQLSEQLGIYHVDDKKIKQDYVMTLMMGVSYIAKKFPKQVNKVVELNHLAGYNAQLSNSNRVSRGNVIYKF